MKDGIKLEATERHLTPVQAFFCNFCRNTFAEKTQF